MSIKVTGLRKSYGAQAAVNDISFELRKGQVTGFLGPNGAGKSTTMKMITGFLQPDAGKILINGLDIKQDSIAAKKLIGYLPEANPLYPDMYVREYLRFAGDVYGIPQLRMRTEEVIQMTGLSPESRKKIGELSKGYRQRVGLAAALIHDPEILILDEPASGLDPNQIIDIRNLIKSLSANKTVLFSSHILQEAEAICDRVMIINHGNIVADDSLQNLINRDNHNLESVFRSLTQ